MGKDEILDWKNHHKIQRAQKLYEDEGLEVIYIAERLGMAIPTIHEWRRRFKWERKRG